MATTSSEMMRASAALPARRIAGFTLIELLVAITVLAIVAVLGWRGLDGIVRARVALTEDMEQTRGMQLAFAQMQRDCSQIVDFSMIPDRPPIVVEAGRIVLVRKVFAENQPSQVQMVAYQLRNGELSRRESPATRDLNALDMMWATVTGEDKQGAPGVVLQSGVTDMRVRIWIKDGAGWRVPGIDAVAFPSSGESTATPVMPEGLEVSLQLQNRSGGMTKVFLLGAV